MLNVKVFDMNGSEQGTMELNETFSVLKLMLLSSTKLLKITSQTRDMVHRALLQEQK